MSIALGKAALLAAGGTGAATFVGMALDRSRGDRFDTWRTAGTALLIAGTVPAFYGMFTGKGSVRPLACAGAALLGMGAGTVLANATGNGSLPATNEGARAGSKHLAPSPK